MDENKIRACSTLYELKDENNSPQKFVFSFLLFWIKHNQLLSSKLLFGVKCYYEGIKHNTGILSAQIAASTVCVFIYNIHRKGDLYLYSKNNTRF